MDKDTTDRDSHRTDLAPHRQVMHALGQKILQDSITTGQDFCKFMIALSVGSIPIYLGLFILALPYDADKGWGSGLAVLVPGSLLLFAAAIFAVGYFPEPVHLTPDMIDHAEKLRLRIIRRRSRLIQQGFSLFILGVFTAMVAIVKAHL